MTIEEGLDGESDEIEGSRDEAYEEWKNKYSKQKFLVKNENSVVEINIASEEGSDTEDIIIALEKAIYRLKNQE